MIYFLSTMSALLFLIFLNAAFLMPVVFAAYKTDVREHSWSGGETMREEENLTLSCSQPPLSNPRTQSKPSYNAHTVSILPIMQCIMPHLICGNGGSSDEGRDGGLCDHAVGSDAVRRGVEPEEGDREREEVKNKRKGEDTAELVCQIHNRS